LVRITAAAPAANNAGGFATQTDVEVGQRILHERFGVGTVVLVENSADGMRIRVQFEHSGERLLLLKFAKIKLL
jgi:DNA helicase-2/ATP-dependent DNA helicase PcrA